MGDDGLRACIGLSTVLTALHFAVRLSRRWPSRYWSLPSFAQSRSATSVGRVKTTVGTVKKTGGPRGILRFESNLT